MLYALILLAIAAVKVQYGVRGLYVVAVASGFAEVHALALSTSPLVAAGRVDGSEGWRIIVIALISNLAFKAAMVTVLGPRRLWKMAVLPFVLTMAMGVAIILLWH